MNITMGVDPDSKAHGVAIYNPNGKLARLECMTLLQVLDFVKTAKVDYCVTVHMEDVCAMNAVFRQRQGKNQGVNMAMSNSIGKCQQAQVELERVFESLDVKVVKHKISKMWKDQPGKKQFEKVTGWTGRSNEDTRSSAYFGWLGVTGK